MSGNGNFPARSTVPSHKLRSHAFSSRRYLLFIKIREIYQDYCNHFPRTRKLFHVQHNSQLEAKSCNLQRQQQGMR